MTPDIDLDAIRAARTWAAEHDHAQPDDRMLAAYGRVLLSALTATRAELAAAQELLSRLCDVEASEMQAVRERDTAHAEADKLRAVVEAARLCMADIKAAWSDERSGPWLTAGQRALYAALDAYDIVPTAGAGDGEQDTATRPAYFNIIAASQGKNPWSNTAPASVQGSADGEAQA